MLIQEIKQEIKNSGSYVNSLFFMSIYNDCLCADCTLSKAHDRQEIMAAAINYEFEHMYCNECNKEIEAAYVD